jgi:lipopolysaccharide transport system ATP-binding protein
MQEIHKQGRTLLFVSHSVQAITRFCERALYLSDGKIVDDGPAKMVVDNYLGTGLQTTTDSTVAERRWDDPLRAPGNEIGRLRAVRVRTEEGVITDTVDIRKPVGVEMEYEVLQPGFVLVPNLHFFNQERIYLFVAADNDADARRPRPAGRYTSTVWIPGNFLSNGPLVVTAALTTPEPTIIHFCEVEVIGFDVIESLEGYKDQLPGVIRPKLPWTTQFTPDHQPEDCLVGEGSLL